jgi:cell division protein FtsQ
MSAATVAHRVGSTPIRALAVLPPRFRRWLVVALGACVLLAAVYQFWLRDSALVAVEDVTVTGLTTKDAARVRAALVSAGHSMTTLHVRQDELEEAIAAYPVVRALEVSPDFPHGLAIHVIEHRPAALVNGLPVAGDGTILRGLPVEGGLPTIQARGDVQGDRLKDPAALHAARVAGAAPAPLRPRLEGIEMRSQDGLVVEMREGPEIIFGDATRVRAKWLAATRVLADPEAEGATYIDVRLPGRPAAGGLSSATVTPVAPAGTPIAPTTGAAATGAATDPTAPATGTPLTSAAPVAGATSPQTATPPATPAPTTPTQPQNPAAGVAGGAGAPASP